MKTTERFRRYEQEAIVLESISKNYPENSDEKRVLKSAAFALCFAMTERHEEFTKYLAHLDKPLTANEGKHLKELGLEP